MAWLGTGEGRSASVLRPFGFPPLAKPLPPSLGAPHAAVGCMAGCTPARPRLKAPRSLAGELEGRPYSLGRQVVHPPIEEWRNVVQWASPPTSQSQPTTMETA